jgi:3-deoxy-manno-octulosonate cytidylyltransferase (CMP-KDO synthetase)
LSFHVIIPARYRSTRFPGKPLADIAGKPMVVRVCERAAQSGAAAVHVATDDDRIGDAVQKHGFKVVPTRGDHPSGTDRLAEAAELVCKADRLGYPIKDGIPVMLEEEARRLTPEEYE